MIVPHFLPVILKYNHLLKSRHLKLLQRHPQVICGDPRGFNVVLGFRFPSLKACGGVRRRVGLVWWYNICSLLLLSVSFRVILVWRFLIDFRDLFLFKLLLYDRVILKFRCKGWDWVCTVALLYSSVFGWIQKKLHQILYQFMKWHTRFRNPIWIDVLILLLQLIELREFHCHIHNENRQVIEKYHRPLIFQDVLKMLNHKRSAMCYNPHSEKFA